MKSHSSDNLNPRPINTLLPVNRDKKVDPKKLIPMGDEEFKEFCDGREDGGSAIVIGGPSAVILRSEVGGQLTSDF